MLFLILVTSKPPATHAGDNGGSTLDFDGSGDYIQVTGYKGITGTADRTVEAWIKTTSAKGIFILEWGGHTSGTRWALKLDGGQFRVEVDGGLIRSDAFVNDDKWHHVAVVFSNDGASTPPNTQDLKLYVDGVLDPINHIHPHSFNTTATVDLGIGYSPNINPDGLGKNFSGQLDEVRIWSVARTQAQIQDAMYGSPADTTGLEAYYKFDDGPGSTTITDSSGNGRTGTLVNMEPAADWLTSTAPIGDTTVNNQTGPAGLWNAVTLASSDGLNIANSNFLNDTGDDIIFGHNNMSNNSNQDLPDTWPGGPDEGRWQRIWYCDLYDEPTTSGGTIDLTFNFSDAGMGVITPAGTADNYRLLQRSGTSGPFIDIATASSVNTTAKTVTFNNLTVSTVCSYYITLGMLEEDTPAATIFLPLITSK